MSTTEMRQDNRLETLEAQVFLSRHRVVELEEQLANAVRMLGELQDRLTLRDSERAILAGQSDGCIRVSELRPILRRVFGDAI